MSTNPNRDQQADASNNYGGYSGYNPSNPADDPYGSRQQQSSTGYQQNDPNYVYGQQQQQQQQQQYYAPGGQQQQQQQSNAYVPPSSVSRNRGTNFNSNIVDARARRAALISYLGLCFTGIVLFVFGRRNRFVRFHAAQSIIVFTPLVIAYLVLQLINGIWLIGALLSPIIVCLTGLIGFVGIVLWIFLMLQAYRGSMFKLPIVGNYAEALMARFSK